MGIDNAGMVRYVGRTMQGVSVRGAQHLSKEGARVVEQQLTNIYGLGRNGGRLLNEINSVAQTYWSNKGIAP